MTTGELIDTMAYRYERYFGGRSAARTVVLGMLDAIAERLVAGEDVLLEHLGVLAVQERKQRAVLFGKPNPNAGMVTRQVTFRDGAGLRRRLNPPS